MPNISYFYGITIRIYFNEHPPAHFHALYGEHIDKLISPRASGSTVSCHAAFWLWCANGVSFIWKS